MKKLSMVLIIGSFSLAMFICSSAKDALAISTFKNEFFETYVKENPSTPEEKAFAELAGATTGKCWVCHVNMTKRGESGLGKKVRNNYGKALSNFLDKENFSSERRDAEPDKVKAEIQAALKKVAAMKSDPKDANSPTFGELIANLLVGDNVIGAVNFTGDFPRFLPQRRAVVVKRTK